MLYLLVAIYSFGSGCLASMFAFDDDFKTEPKYRLLLIVFLWPLMAVLSVARFVWRQTGKEVG
jgi:hypothetical protein